MSLSNIIFENKDLKKLTAYAAVIYGLGALILNIYLGSLGVFTFDLIKLRYIFIGVLFMIATFALDKVLSFLTNRFKIRRRKKMEGEYGNEEWRTENIPDESKKSSFRALYLAIGFIFWTSFYSTVIFPQLPPFIGGGEPLTVRFIGTEENIRDINAAIKYSISSGVQSDWFNEVEMPITALENNSQLFLSANVQLLDSTADTHILLLPHGLYFSSISSFAYDYETSLEKTDSKYLRPLYIDKSKTVGMTFKLVNPPTVTTRKDLAIINKMLLQTKDNKSYKKAKGKAEEWLKQKGDYTAKAALGVLRKAKNKEEMQSQITKVIESDETKMRDEILDAIQINDRGRTKQMMHGKKKKFKNRRQQEQTNMPGGGITDEVLPPPVPEPVQPSETPISEEPKDTEFDDTTTGAEAPEDGYSEVSEPAPDEEEEYEDADDKEERFDEEGEEFLFEEGIDQEEYYEDIVLQMLESDKPLDEAVRTLNEQNIQQEYVPNVIQDLNFAPQQQQITNEYFRGDVIRVDELEELEEIPFDDNREEEKPVEHEEFPDERYEGEGDYYEGDKEEYIDDFSDEYRDEFREFDDRTMEDGRIEEKPIIEDFKEPLEDNFRERTDNFDGNKEEFRRMGPGPGGR